MTFQLAAFQRKRGKKKKKVDRSGTDASDGHESQQTPTSSHSDPYLGFTSDGSFSMDEVNTSPFNKATLAYVKKY